MVGSKSNWIKFLNGIPLKIPWGGSNKCSKNFYYILILWQTSSPTEEWWEVQEEKYWNLFNGGRLEYLTRVTIPQINIWINMQLGRKTLTSLFNQILLANFGPNISRVRNQDFEKLLWGSKRQITKALFGNHFVFFPSWYPWVSRLACAHLN